MKCSAPVEGHTSRSEELKCPAHGKSDPARRSARAPSAPTSPDGAYPNADVTAKASANGAATRGLRVSGTLTAAHNSVVEDCVAGAITVNTGATLTDCHAIESGQQEDRPPNAFIEGYCSDISMTNCTAQGIKLQIRNSSIVDCHARGNFAMESAVESEVVGCTSDRMIVLDDGYKTRVVITEPGQIFVSPRSNLECAVECPIDLTIILPSDHPWHNPRSGDDVTWINKEIALRRSLVLRPKDGSHGLWLDARNEKAWEALLESADLEACSVEDSAVFVALALYPNP